MVSKTDDEDEEPEGILVIAGSYDDMVYPGGVFSVAGEPPCGWNNEHCGKGTNCFKIHVSV